MSKLIMLSGVPGSGKSSYSEVLKEKENAIVLSSDEIYVELTGDTEHTRSNGPKEFEELYKRVRENLKKNQNVIIDATNISSKKRKGRLEQFKDAKVKELHQFIVPFEETVERDLKRNRTVGKGVIKNMYLNINIPMENEGFDSSYVYVDESFKNYIGNMTKEKLLEIIQKNEIHDYMFRELSEIKYFKDIFNLPQDSSYHSFSVSRHTYHVLQYINENYEESDKLVLQVTALFHDIGKALAKKFDEGKRYANFIGHENTSAQIAYGILTVLGFEEDFVKEVSKLTQLHMRMPREGSTEKAMNKFLALVDEKTLNQLTVFRKADESAK